MNQNNKTPTPSSIKAYTKYGIHTSVARYLTYNHFYLSEEHKDLFHELYTRKWNTTYFLDHMYLGELSNQGIDYQVIYYKTDPSKLNRRKKLTQVLLSFRIPDPVFNIPATVLVKEIRENKRKS